MKRSPFLFLVLVALPALSSCAHTLYKHQQLLASCRTREDVLKWFGFPNEKIRAKNTEEWIYNLDKNPNNVVTRAPLPIDSLHMGLAINYAKYLKFTFDSQGNVTGYVSNVADAAGAIIKRRGHDAALRVMGAILIFGVVIYVALITKSDITY